MTEIAKLTCPKCGSSVEQSKCQSCRRKIHAYKCENCGAYILNPEYRNGLNLNLDQRKG
jgi:NAD-dependent SIR2 family protein deacetylase